MRASASVTVDHPIDDVFAFVADVENMDRWVTGVGDPGQTSDGDPGVGTTLASTYTYRGTTHDVEYEVTAYDPPTRYAMRSTEGPFPFEGSLDLESVEGGTRVSNTIDAGSDSTATTVIFTLFGPVLRRMMARRLAGELDELADALDRDGPTADRTESST